jgi:hypothetical protein
VKIENFNKLKMGNCCSGDQSAIGGGGSGGKEAELNMQRDIKYGGAA